jgi:hypothetical protein
MAGARPLDSLREVEGRRCVLISTKKFPNTLCLGLQIGPTQSTNFHRLRLLGLTFDWTSTRFVPRRFVAAALGAGIAMNLYVFIINTLYTKKQP